MNVSNHSCIRRLSLRALRASRTRNLVAVLAIALTAILFTSLFTIALSINEGIQQNNFRQAGGCSHGTFKYLTRAQCDALKDDPLIRAYGVRRFLGMPTEAPFNKDHVEIGYSDENQAHWGFCDPAEGRLPREGTDEAATDTRVLELLGVEPATGARFTVTFEVDGQTTTQTFTLSGWWEYDEAVPAHHLLIPESRLDAVLAETGVTPPGSDGMVGSWNLDVMLKNGAGSIAADMDRILANHGYQSQTAGEDYISIGVNWGYTGALLADKLDAATASLILGVLGLILLTGYLIIYNVFQISVAGDIRFYGLLKAIGTTPRQLRRIIRIQALLLSLAGIPLGLLVGWLLGGVLTPVITARLNGVRAVVSVSPLLFAGAALFALATVLISCRRPGRLAGKVSPVEAVRYTEAQPAGRRAKRNGRGVSLLSMAWANLGRSRGRTAVTVLSLALAVVLLELTWTFTSGFDMEKYLRDRAAADYILASGDYFQSNYRFAENILPEQAVAGVQARGTVTEGGRVYGSVTTIWDAVDESWYREAWTDAYAANGQLELLEEQIATRPRSDDGKLYTPIELYGMEDFPRSRLTVIDGDLAPLADPAQNAIAAVYTTDDYDNVQPGSAWAQVGDTVTLRYVQATEAYYTDTGETIPDDADWALVEASGRPYSMRATEYRDVTYTVCAAVTVPSTLSFRYVGGDQFLLNGDRFVQDTGTAATMCYAFNTTAESNAAMEDYLQEYTGSIDPTLDYESKQGYAAEFEGLRGMFTVVGCALAFVIGLVGVLNFLNAILTGIITRRREFAVLQAVGMTGRQLKTMLIFEGLGYTLLALLLALAVSAAAGPLAGPAVEKLFWFFTYRFTAAPLLALLPVFLLLGCVVPLASYRAAARQTVVERLRAAD